MEEVSGSGSDSRWDGEVFGSEPVVNRNGDTMARDQLAVGGVVVWGVFVYGSGV